MVAWLLVLLIGSGLGHRPPMTVDLIELNNKYIVFNGVVQLGFQQVIFWRWCPAKRRHESVGWFIVNQNRLGDYPVQSGDWTKVRVQIPGSHVVVAQSKMYRETHTLYDPELVDRKSREANGQRP